MKDSDPKAFNRKCIKFYIYHIIHFFKNEKKSPETYYIFYEGAFKYLNKIFSDDNFYCRYLFEINTAFSDYIVMNENITKTITKERDNMNSFIIKENLEFLGKTTNIRKKINNELIDLEERTQLNNIDNNNDSEDVLTTKLLKFCELAKAKIEVAENVIKKEVKDFVCKELDKFKKEINELIDIVKKYHLTNSHFSLMVRNYSDDNDKIIIDYTPLLEQWKEDNDILSQDLEKDFKEIIESRSFQDLYLIAMHSSYVREFVEEKKLGKKYQLFMDNYASKIDKLILYVPLTKGIKAYVSNYFRIALNIHSVNLIGDFKGYSKTEMYISYLLVNLLHESFHFIYRLDNKKGTLAKNSMSPETHKIMDTYREIGVDLILHIFGTEYINFISIENSKLLNEQKSWKNKGTNFRVFDELYLLNDEIKNKKEEKELGTGLKCNISMNEHNNKVNEGQYCNSYSIRWCY